MLGRLHERLRRPDQPHRYQRSPVVRGASDNKWFTRAVVAAAVIDTLEDLNLGYPTVDPEMKKQLEAAKAQLQNPSKKKEQQSSRAPSK